MAKYPKREPYFAQKAIRLLVKTAAAQHIGQTAALLVVTVVTTEDAARYRRPVTFFNNQLMMLLGIRKWESLDHARKVAIESGWLCYEAPPKGKHKPGLYWVTIPPEAIGLADSPVDEAYPEVYPENGYAPPEESPVNGDSSGDSAGDRRGDRRGEHSDLTLSPNPKDLSPSATCGFSDDKPASPSGEKPKKPKVEYEPEFEAFWGMVLDAAKHKAVKKGESAKRYSEAVRKLGKRMEDPHAFLLDKARAYYRSPEGQTQYANSPAPWLNQGRYDDDPAAWQRAGSADRNGQDPAPFDN
jgi:hypothetical protein